MGENIESGYKFGQLALRQLSQSNIHSFRAMTFHLVNYFILHWKKHVRESLEPLLEGYQSGLEVGDLESAAYCVHTYCCESFIAGKELVEINREITAYSEVVLQIKQELSLTWLQLQQQTILNLMGRSSDPTRLIGEFYNEERKLTKLEALNDGIELFVIYFTKLFLCYLVSEYAQAVENAVLSEPYVPRVAATSLIPLHCLYDSLARLATYPECSVQVQEESLEKVVTNQGKMKQWAGHAPMNYLHKYYLVEAEKARVVGQWFEAEEFYEQAIQGARDNEYLQEEGLAYELAAKHYLARGRERFAQIYMKEAYYCYERWGAMAKVKDLESRYPQFFPQSSSVSVTPIHKTSGTHSKHSNITFDLVAVMKASQAISSEIELDRLLRSLMKILIENAGAQTGFLILENSGEWVIEAAYEPDLDETDCTSQVLQSIPTANYLPESIIQYVIRTRESIILNNAAFEGNFTNEPYIQQQQSQSIFCLPLLNQSNLVGVLYLENRLATEVFTPERSQVLNLLSTQAAIAIKNARLYSKLRASESKMTQFLEAIPVGIGIVDAASRPYYANQQAIQLLGKGIDPAVPPEQIAEVYQLYATATGQLYPTTNLPIIRALSGESSRIDDLEIHQDNVIIPVEAWGTPVFDEQGNVNYAIAAFQDISQRKQAESMAQGQQIALQNTLASLATEPELDKFLGQVLTTMVEQLQAPIAEIWLSDVEQEKTNLYLRRWNPQLVPNPPNATCSTSVPFSAFQIGSAWESLHQHHEPFVYLDFPNHPDREIFRDWSAVVDGVQTLLLTPLVFGGEVLGVFSISHLQHHPYPPEALHLVTALAQQVVLAIQLTRLAEDAKQGALVEEHNRLAREIHDTLAQTFTAISLQLNNAQYYANQDPALAWELVEQVKTLARTGLAEARRSVWSLHPEADEYRNLAESLQRSLTQLTQHTSLQADLAIVGTPQPVPPDIGMNLLRIAQEATTNTLRHAQAQTLQLELTFRLDAIELRIQDDGQGFNPKLARERGGFGLLGMQQRCDRLNGQLTLQSQPGQGSCILIQIPLTPSKS
jgi:PAS domain S-box-containing protein